MPLEAGGVLTFFPLAEGGGISVVRRCEVVFGVMLVNWI
jgi:hypothetical protein